MKFTQILCKQHIGKAVRYLWQHQRERRIIVSNAESILKSMNIAVQDAREAVLPPKKEWFTFEPTITKQKTECNTFPVDCNGRNLIFEDHNVPQEGISQACLLTKTLKIDDDLPETVVNLVTDIPSNINSLVERVVCSSVIYDSQQVKLPKLKDPERPAWNFPRKYGISTRRKVYNLSKRFLQLCETLNGLDIAQFRLIVHDGLCSTSIGVEDDFINLSLKMDTLMTSSIPLTPIVDAHTQYEFDMPDIYPLHHTIGLQKSNIYKTEDIYPINKDFPFLNVHTIVIHYDSEEVKNTTELPVTENQIHARSMMKSFTVAAACARQRFGSNVKELPEPVVVQCVQTNGQSFHFSVYQLNTLDISHNQSIHNFWWSKPSIKLYDVAQYENGRPCIEGYNSEVFEKFLAFYKNK